MRLNTLSWPLPALFGATLSVALLLPGPGAAQTVNGRAYAIYASTPAGSIAQSPMAVLPAISGTDGDLATAESDGLNVGNVVNTTFLHSITSGALGTADATAQSVTTTGATSILNGLITTQGVTAVAASHRTATGAVSSGTGSSLTDLVVAGNQLTSGDGTIAPNTRISLPGVGYAVLNEQIPSGDGVSSSGLTVNMIHVYLVNLLGNVGEIVVGSATSSVGP